MKTELQNYNNITAETANFWSRALAFIIDGILLFFFSLALIFCAGYVSYLGANGNPVGFLAGFGLFLFLFPVISICLATLYFALLHSWGGRTIGKIFMGIKVESNQGEFLTPGASFLRLTGYFLSALPVGSGFLWAVLDRNHATWHDKLAGSRVVYDCGK
ncbi:MAG: RDD family protein [Desulfobulbaceae bacterium]|uniref:RDD family protein n=1 Tax=Candidatus Desulfobia pelagia TaxID=2841692 RepID=A0A8J6NFU2_9BACT|nr:RDD family protein [Candidatus Desulfobia pelagia]